MFSGLMLEIFVSVFSRYLFGLSLYNGSAPQCKNTESYLFITLAQKVRSMI